MKNDFPVVDIRPSEPLQDYFGDGLGNRWNVARLIDATKNEPVFLIPLAGMDLSACIFAPYCCALANCQSPPTGGVTSGLLSSASVPGFR